jgi:hypothetical protein
MRRPKSLSLERNGQQAGAGLRSVFVIGGTTLSLIGFN